MRAGLAREIAALEARVAELKAADPVEEWELATVERHLARRYAERDEAPAETPADAGAPRQDPPVVDVPASPAEPAAAPVATVPDVDRSPVAPPSAAAAEKSK